MSHRTYEEIALRYQGEEPDILKDKAKWLAWMRKGAETYTLRSKAVQHWAWGIPSAAALDAIKALGKPVVELGAGRGYWAWRLRRHGVKVDAYDLRGSTHRRQGKRWLRVKRGTPLTVRKKRFASHALLLCWPPYDEPEMGFEALRQFRGDHVIYIGEGHGGCTACNAFHEELERHWEKVQEVDIPQWDGLHDYLTIWKRKKGAMACATKRRPWLSRLRKAAWRARWRRDMEEWRKAHDEGRDPFAAFVTPSPGLKSTAETADTSSTG